MVVGIEGLPSSGKSEPQNIESGHDGMSIMSMCFLVLYMMAIIGHDHYHLDMRHFSIINRGQMEQIDYFFSFLFFSFLFWVNYPCTIEYLGLFLIPIKRKVDIFACVYKIECN